MNDVARKKVSLPVGSASAARAALRASLVAVVLVTMALVTMSQAACSCAGPDVIGEPEPEPDPSVCPALPNGDEGSECVRIFDCQAGALCVKPDDATSEDVGCCEKVFCDSDEDCWDDEVCDVERGACLPSSLCDPNADDDGCASSERCIVIEHVPTCVPADGAPAASANTCEIIPRAIAARDGDAVRFDVGAFDAARNRIPYIEPTLSIDANGSLDVDADGHDILTAELRGTFAVLCHAHATVDDVACAAPVLVWPPRPADAQTRVLVIEAETNLPIEDASASLGLTGGTQTAVTDESGQAAFAPYAGVPDALAIEAPGFRSVAILEPGPLGDVIVR